MADAASAIRQIQDKLTHLNDSRERLIEARDAFVRENAEILAHTDEQIAAWTAVLEAVEPKPAKRTAKK